MRIAIKKFGEVLTSRQSGREAYAAFLPTLGELDADEALLLDFEGVTVLSPSWADEFLTPLLATFGPRLVVTATENPSIQLTLKTLEEILGQKFVTQPSRTSL